MRVECADNRFWSVGVRAAYVYLLRSSIGAAVARSASLVVVVVSTSVRYSRMGYKKNKKKKQINK